MKTLVIFSVLVVCSLVSAVGDLNSDKIALLRFASSVRHGRKLKWTNGAPLCTSWAGVICASNQTHVTAVRLPSVGLTGPVPPNTLGSLKKLKVLSLVLNGLTGSLPQDILDLPFLDHLYAHHNFFSGNFPSTFPPNLIVLDLSFNSFTGNIPSTILFMTRLTSLKLQNNSLTGSIPSLTLARLRYLNISNNHLSGSIPISLKTFPMSSFLGNDLLCGPPLRPCSPTLGLPPPLNPTAPTHPPIFSLPNISLLGNDSTCDIPSQPCSPNFSSTAATPPPHVASQHIRSKKLPLWAIITVVVGSGFVIIIIVSLSIWYCLKKKESEKPGEESGDEVQMTKLDGMAFFGKSWSLQEVLDAPGEIVSKAVYGTTYKAVLEVYNLVVTRLSVVVVGQEQFAKQIEVIKALERHSNVVPLIGYYYSDEGQLLLYDCDALSSLFTLLHGNSNPLSWVTRVKVVLGAAKGIAHMHLLGGPDFVHGYIRSTNILVNKDEEGCICDGGLALLVSLANNDGYEAPEENRTQKSDVYSFGVILLETITGKHPLQSPEMVDLPKLVMSLVSKCSDEVFDSKLRNLHTKEEEMVKFLQIGLMCVMHDPEKRPAMGQVVNMIREVGMLNTET